MTTALCHSDRAHTACGLCAPCYQRFNKGRAPELGRFVAQWSEVKAQAIAARSHARKASVDKRRKGAEWRYVTLRYRYGLSREQHEAMVETQGNRCLICDAPPKPGAHLYVDHCHDTGRVRGLLCPSCNTAVGVVEKGADYLAKIGAYLTPDPDIAGTPPEP